MIKEVIGTGATIEEARRKALAELNAKDTDDIKFDVISTGKKKFLGLFGGEEAQIRVSVEIPDEKPRKKPANKPNKPRNDRKPAEKAVNNDKKAEPKAEKKAEKKAEPAKKAAEQPAHAPSSVEDDYKNAVDASQIAADSPASRAVRYLTEILTQFGCTGLTAKVAEKENGAFIIFDGEGLGAVIGHRGETLDALQYLAGLAANNGGGYYKVSLNIGNYREKREQTLTALAKRVCEQVLSTGRSRVLEPMNPYERRIIHTAVQEVEGVISGSIGEGSNRRVVIAVEGTDIRTVRAERRGARRDNRRGGHSGRDRKPSNTVATAPTREPKKDSDIPLYGKIN